MSNLVGFRSRGDGLRIGASEWNAIGDVVNRYRQRMNGESGAGYPSPNDYSQSLQVRVINNTGGTLLARGIIGIGDRFLEAGDDPEEDERKLVHLAVTPSAGGIIGVLQEPLTENDRGLATIAGFVLCSVNVTDAAHGYANSTTSTTVLTSGATGAHRIVWKESGTGTKWAVVMLGFSSGATFGDAAFDVSGIINRVDQYLGKGKKEVESLRAGGYDFIGGTAGFNMGGIIFGYEAAAAHPNAAIKAAGFSLQKFNTSTETLGPRFNFVALSNPAGNEGSIQLRADRNGATDYLMFSVAPLHDLTSGSETGSRGSGVLSIQSIIANVFATGSETVGQTASVGGLNFSGGIYFGGTTIRANSVGGATNRAITFTSETI